MARDLDEHVEQFRTRRREDAGPFMFVATVSYLARYSGDTHDLYADQLRRWFA